MTDLQIKYWAGKENERHNAAMEAYNLQALAETRRSNLAREKLGTDTLAETIRSNSVREYHSALQANSTVRKTDSEVALNESRRADIEAGTDLTKQKTVTEKYKSQEAKVDAEFAEASKWLYQTQGWGSVLGKAISAIDRLFGD